MLADHHSFAQEWVSAWNAHDLERILSHYADDVVFRSPFVAKLTGEKSGELRGKAALRGYFAKALAENTALRFHLRRVLLGVGSVVLIYDSINNLVAAEMMERNAAGQATRVSAHYSSEQ